MSFPLAQFWKTTAGEAESREQTISSSSRKWSGKRAAKPAIAILGVPFDNVTIQDAIDLIEEMVASRRPHYLVTANVDFLVQAQTDVELRRILFDSHLVLCDGTPLVWASRLLGNPLPERVAGADLVPLLMRLAAERKYRVFLLGATPESAERAVNNLTRQYDKLIIAGHYSPPFNKLLEMDHEEIKRRIIEARPDLLFVSFGCPKQEKWIAMHYRTLGVPVAAGVGATIDFLAGEVKRAPVWMQRIGAEWLYRLSQEPRRLFGRYAKDLWVFGIGILRQWRHLRSRPQQQTEEATIPESNDASFQILKAPERLDLRAASEGAVPVEKIAESGQHCLLHMAGVEFIDSSGLGLLIQLQKRLGANGCQLVLLAASTPVQKALELMRLESFFATASDVSAAQNLLQTFARERANGAKAETPGTRQMLKWEGEITAANAEAIWSFTRDHLVAAAEDSQPEVIINLGDVRFIDSSGLGVMVRTRKLAQRHGTRLIFTSIQPLVKNVLQLSRMEEFLLGHSTKRR